MKTAQKTNFTQVPNQLIRTPYLTSSAKTVLMVIMSYTPSYPSYGSIMTSTGLSRPTVSKAIAELVTANVISYVKGSNLKGTCNQYSMKNESEWTLGPSKESLLPLVKKLNSNNTKNTYTIGLNNLTTPTDDIPVVATEKPLASKKTKNPGYAFRNAIRALDDMTTTNIIEVLESDELFKSISIESLTIYMTDCFVVPATITKVCEYRK